ncbi:MAG: RND family efflux transporter MFP subunit [Planctomycetota bacterium]|jgi:RND family efflux transporter MFP subunit
MTSAIKTLLLALLGCVLLGAATTPPGNNAKAFVDIEAIIRPSRIVHVGSAADGLLQSVLVDEGDTVQAGQLIAELEQTVERAAANLAKARSSQVATLRAAEVKLGHLEERFANHQSLFEDGILSSENLGQSQLDRHMAEFDVLAAQERSVVSKFEYRRARAVVDRGQIQSPVAGVVIDRSLSPGELVGRSGESTIVTIAQLDPLVVEAFAPVGLLGQLHAGMKAEITILKPRKQTKSAVIKTISPIVDAASGTFSVRLELPNPDFQIAAGLRCSIRFTK